VLGEFVDVVAINGEAGSFPHRIEPVDDALDDAIAALEQCGAEFAVVFDADADRGNLVLREADGRARELPPQDVAMLNVAAMLAWVTAHADRYPELKAGKLAVVAHGATSSRVADVAHRFGAELVEVETGEVNVVARMRELSREGYFVPVGVEGSNGGTVFHGAVVRDGTLTALMALLAVADAGVAAVLSQRFPQDAVAGEPNERATRLVDVLDSLPTYYSIQANLAAAAAGASQADIKREFEDRMLERLGEGPGGAMPRALESLTPADSVFLNYEETRVLEGRGHRQSQTGGFKLLLTDTEGGRHFFWFRVSKTEAGMARVVADSPREAVARELFDFGRELYQGAVASAARQELFASDRPVLLVATDRQPPRDLNCFEIPRGLDVVVAGRRGLAQLHAGNLIAALAEHDNTVRWAESLGLPPSKSGCPDLVVAPEGDPQVQSDLQVLASAAERSVAALYFPTLASRVVNLAVGGEPRDMEAVRQGVREHGSQIARTDYLAVLEWESRMAVAHASLAQLWPDDQARGAANVFLVGAIGLDGETCAPQPRHSLVASSAPASAGFEPLHIGPGHHVLVLSPHPDDAEIAAGMLLREALRLGATVHNVVHSGGHNGVTNEYPCGDAVAQAGQPGVSALARVAAWAGIDTDAAREHPRRLKEAVRLLEVEAAAIALAEGLPPGSGLLHVQQLALDHPGEDDQRDTVSDAYEAVLMRHLATAGGAPWIVVLPHPEDAHPTHRATSARALDVLRTLADGRTEIRLVYYRAPWSGTSNTYFLAAANERVAGAADLSGDLCLAVKSGKQALAILVGELVARRFGLAAPSPEEMGGAFAEEFRRAVVEP